MEASQGQIAGGAPGPAKLVFMYLGELLRYGVLDPIPCKTVDGLGGPLQWWRQKKDLIFLLDPNNIDPAALYSVGKNKQQHVSDIKQLLSKH